MAEYIELQTAIDFVKNNTPTLEGMTTLGCVERALYNAPKADVEEVVRCKDCNYYFRYGDGGHGCGTDVMTKPRANGFCSYGERRKGK